MTSKSQVRCNDIHYCVKFLSVVGKLTMSFGHKLGQNPYLSIVQAKI